MAYRMVCLIKQVPDTRNIKSNVLREDGTLNRQELPAVINPDDLFALEMALGVKDNFGGKVTAITMGPPMAIEVLKEALGRGADDAVLLSDRKFAGADTLATSRVLGRAISKIGHFDLIFCGRQSIDGDTAQVGPQIAEKLNLPQVTLAEAIEHLHEDDVVLRRVTDGGFERLHGRIPLLVTVTNTAARPRPPSVKRLMYWKKANISSNIESEEERQKLEKRGLIIPVWNSKELGCSENICGFVGSPTQIKCLESEELTPRNHKYFDPSEQGIKDFIQELIGEHMI